MEDEGSGGEVTSPRPASVASTVTTPCSRGTAGSTGSPVGSTYGTTSDLLEPIARLMTSCVCCCGGCTCYTGAVVHASSVSAGRNDVSALHITCNKAPSWLV